MEKTLEVEARGQPSAANEDRARLLAGMPVSERTVPLAGIPTAVLEGGSGEPLVLLHGPGESGVNWRWVIPELVKTHRVVVPDLPAHGASGGAGYRIDARRMVTWLDALINATCASPPVVVGQVLGGAIAARYAVARGDRLRGLVLVDALGLAPFRPSPRFLLGLVGFQVRPSEGMYYRFMRQCAFDLDALRRRMGDVWEPFVSYNLQAARSPNSKTAGRIFRAVGLPAIRREDLARIAVPTTLIWGRHDRALRLPIAEAASARYGWPLHVIEDAADDPPRDQPEAFLRALQSALAGGG